MNSDRRPSSDWLVLGIWIAFCGTATCQAAGFSSGGIVGAKRSPLLGMQLILMAGAGCGAIMLILASSFPRQAARVVDVGGRMPLRSLLLGLTTTALTGIIVRAMVQKAKSGTLGGAEAAVLKGCTLGILAFVAICVLWGMIAKSANLGRRIAMLFRRDVAYSWGFLIGWPTLVLAALIWGVGWIILGYYAVAAFGTSVMWLVTGLGRKGNSNAEA